MGKFIKCTRLLTIISILIYSFRSSILFEDEPCTRLLFEIHKTPFPAPAGIFYVLLILLWFQPPVRS